jgi:hypothetical protein
MVSTVQETVSIKTNGKGWLEIHVTLTACCRQLSSGMLHHVVWKILSNVSDMHRAAERCTCWLPWWWRQYTPLKCLSTSIRIHGATSQKAAIFIFVVMRTWYLTTCQIAVISAVTWIAFPHLTSSAVATMISTCMNYIK